MSPQQRQRRIETLQLCIVRYEQTIARLSAINRKLRELPHSERRLETLLLNQDSLAATTRLLDAANIRLSVACQYLPRIAA